VEPTAAATGLGRNAAAAVEDAAAAVGDPPAGDAQPSAAGGRTKVIAAAVRTGAAADLARRTAPAGNEAVTAVKNLAAFGAQIGTGLGRTAATIRDPAAAAGLGQRAIPAHQAMAASVVDDSAFGIRIGASAAGGGIGAGVAGGEARTLVVKRPGAAAAHPRPDRQHRSEQGSNHVSSPHASGDPACSAENSWLHLASNSSRAHQGILSHPDSRPRLKNPVGSDLPC
jgi:hypothetical protein